MNFDQMADNAEPGLELGLVCCGLITVTDYCEPVLRNSNLSLLRHIQTNSCFYSCHCIKRVNWQENNKLVFTNSLLQERQRDEQRRREHQ